MMYLTRRTHSRRPLLQAGFTLIELLVVISIIALLASVILASLSTARQKGQYASVQESLIQMRNVYELQYSNAGSDDALLPSGISTSTVSNPSQYLCSVSGVNNYCAILNSTGCDSLYNAGSQADNICKDIANKMGSSGLFYFGIVNAISTSDYSFAVTNPSVSGQLFCIRSSGGNITTSSGFLNCLNRNNW